MTRERCAAWFVKNVSQRGGHFYISISNKTVLPGRGSCRAGGKTKQHVFFLSWRNLWTHVTPTMLGSKAAKSRTVFVRRPRFLLLCGRANHIFNELAIAVRWLTRRARCAQTYLQKHTSVVHVRAHKKKRRIRVLISSYLLINSARWRSHTANRSAISLIGLYVFLPVFSCSSCTGCFAVI